VLVAGVPATVLAQVKTFRRVIPLAVISLVCSLARVGIMYYQIGSRDLMSTCTPSFEGVTPMTTFNSLATTGLLFGGHGMFPEEIREMKRPESYFGALHSAYVIMIVVYLSNTYVAYAVWGDWTAGDNQFNWPLNEATFVSVVLSSIWALIEMTISHVMLFSTIEKHLEQWWGAGRDRPEGKQRVGPWRRRLLRVLGRSAFVWTEVFFALMLSSAGIANIQAFCGAVGFAALTYCAPFAAYWKLLGRHDPLVWQLCYLVVGLSGVGLMVVGTYSSVAGSLDQLEQYHLFDTSQCSANDVLDMRSCSNPCREAYGVEGTCTPGAGA